jgi:hypothetical protein
VQGANRLDLQYTATGPDSIELFSFFGLRSAGERRFSGRSCHRSVTGTALQSGRTASGGEGQRTTALGWMGNRRDGAHRSGSTAYATRIPGMRLGPGLALSPSRYRPQTPFLPSDRRHAPGFRPTVCWRIGPHSTLWPLHMREFAGNSTPCTRRAISFISCIRCGRKSELLPRRECLEERDEEQ